MDRNLGAMGANKGDCDKSIGNYYEFGRKDPFRRYDTGYDITGLVVEKSVPSINPTSQTSNMITYSVVNPAVFITNSASDWSPINSYRNNLWFNPSWNTLKTEKSFFDPCPVGWKVPKDGVWDGLFKNPSGNSEVISKFGAFIYCTGIKDVGEAAWFPFGAHRTPSLNGIGTRGGVRTSNIWCTMGSQGAEFTPRISTGRNEACPAYGVPVRCIQE